MDLSLYYEKFQSTYNIAIVAVFLAVFVLLFIGIRSIKDRQEPLWQKIVVWILLVVILSCVVVYFFVGPYHAKKDIDEKTIHYYEGTVEIVEITSGIFQRATFVVDGREVRLKFFEDNGYDHSLINAGKYEAKIVYAEHLAELLYFEINY